jgi:branched-chain amino acid transport system substrate-binding protein
VAGAKAYFSLTNDEGGVNGRKLRLVAYDDSYDPAKTQSCFDKLMADNVFALGFFVGTPTAVKYLPMAEENKIPVVGLFTGAQILYAPMRHWIVTVRASYYDETREQIDGLWNTLGYRKIGVIYPDDAFGAAVVDGVKASLKAHGAEPTAVASYQRQTAKVDTAISSVRAAGPQAVVVVGPPNTVAPIVKRAHAAGWKPLFLTVSFVGTEE